MKDQLSILSYLKIMKKKTKDYLKFTDIEIYQDDTMFCINSDTAILGNFLDFKSNLEVLDIGTNNGALLLYASRFKPKSLTGIDINEEAIELARMNLEMNNIEAKLYAMPIQEFKETRFDIIICNPPFFKCNNIGQNKLKANAMFESELVIDDLFFSFKRLLKDNGMIYLIYDASRLSEIYEQCFKNNLKIINLAMVYDDSRPYAKRVLMKLKKGKCSEVKILKPIIIKNGNINYN